MKRNKLKAREILIEQAIMFSKEGFTTREIGSLLGKSHTWVAEIVKKDLQRLDKDI